VSRSVQMPAEYEVRAAAREIIEQTRETGHRPSVLAVARRFGLSNTTFRRNFPDVARELGEQRRTPPTAVEGSAAAARENTLRERHAIVLREKENLREHLELAAANIMRLTLENRQLRRELEAVSKVTRIAARSDGPGQLG
jgi:AraC-like DNA-binding protein